jgi:putative oxidoreductase
MSRIAFFVGRALIAYLFILAGMAKLTGPQPFLGHMVQHGVPGELLPLVAALELATGLGILTGIFMRPAAAVLGLFCVATAFLFHLVPGDHAERTLFLKDLAIAGGLFVLAASRPVSRYLADSALAPAPGSFATRTSSQAALGTEFEDRSMSE